MDQLSDLGAFVAVFEAQSFSAAARRLQVTTAGVSKAVIRLESRLSVRLFTRTTRRVVATEEGNEFYRHARDIINRLSEAEAAIASGSQGLSGVVRIAAPVLLGQNVLAPLLSELRALHPAIVLDVQLTDAFTAIIDQGVDIALRFGSLQDSSLIGRKLCDTRFVTCASPAYLARYGAPTKVSDLQAHDCITYVVNRSGKPFAWRFKAKREFMPVRSVIVSDGGALRAFGLAGHGLIQEIDVAIAPDLESGLLVQVLQDSISDGPALWLLQPAGRNVTRRVRTVVDGLVTRLGIS